MKICPVGAELFHADGQMDVWRDRNCEANSQLLQFCGNAYRVRMYGNYTNPFIIYISDATSHEVRINFITKVSCKKNARLHLYSRKTQCVSIMYHKVLSQKNRHHKLF